MTINIFGYKIELSFLFIASITILLMLDPSNIILMGIFAAYIHEFGHIIIMKKLGYSSKYLIFSPFKINIIDANKHIQSFSNELLILLSGPLVNLIFSIITFIIYNFFPYKTLLYFCFENLFLSIFNLMPITSLDGGDILFIILNRKLDTQKAKFIIKLLSIIIIILLFIFGIYIFIKSKYNFSIIALSIYLAFTTKTKN